MTGLTRSLLSLASVLTDRVPVFTTCVLGEPKNRELSKVLSSEAGPEDHLKHGHWTENRALTIQLPFELSGETVAKPFLNRLKRFFGRENEEG